MNLYVLHVSVTYYKLGCQLNRREGILACLELEITEKFRIFNCIFISHISFAFQLC